LHNKIIKLSLKANLIKLESDGLFRHFKVFEQWDIQVTLKISIRIKFL